MPHLSFPLRQHGRYTYDPIVARPRFQWPDGSRLAVFIALNLEQYAFGEGLVEDLVPNMPPPDVLNNSWRDYGNRVGAWRLLELCRTLELPVTLLINSELYTGAPGLVEAFRAAGAEIASHGRTNSEHQGELDEAAERALITEVTRTIAEHEGAPPAGWLSPWIAETPRTPDLLHEAGYSYLMDWCMDDQPVWLKTRTGHILSLPYPQEINDSAAIMGRQVGASEFADMIVDQFDELLLQSRDQPLAMGIALHSMIVGQPFRLRHLRRALEHIASRRADCWLARAGEIAAHAQRVLPSRPPEETDAMQDIELVVRNAQLVTASDTTRCDIGIHAGRVVALGLELPRAPNEIDAAGRVVTPGGVDAHCHFDQPMAPPVRMADDFDSGTRSAACGGTTTVIPFAAQAKGQSLRAAVDDYHRRAQDKAHIDYAFHLIVSDPTPTVLNEELPALIREGYTSFKIYMTYDDLRLGDGQILDVLALAREHGAMAMIHAENADCIEWLTKRLEAAGRTAPRYHAASRPLLVEREATHRAIALSELVDVPILVVHVSGREAVEQIRWARGHGLTVLAETCPQYLFLTADDLGLDDSYHGARCVCSPPPRDRSNQQVIWNGLADGLFTVFSSDHAPFRYDAPEGKKPGGEEVPFRHIPNGIPGVETRLALLYSEGVLGRRISANRFVELTSTNPAKAYGLHPRKGTIAVGSDADLVIWDEREFTLSNSMLHHAVDYTPYEGMRLRAWPALTLSRGEVVWDATQFFGRRGRGEFQRRGLPTLLPRRA